MANEMVISFQVLEGPSLLAPFSGVMATFQTPLTARLPSERLQPLVTAALPDLAPLPAGDLSFGALATFLTTGIRDAQGDCGYRHQLTEAEDGTCRIAIEQSEAQQGIYAMQAGLELAIALQEELSQGSGPLSARLPRIRETCQALWSLSPGHSTSRVVRLARWRGIPVYSPDTHLMSWLIGHGPISRLIANTGDDRDALSASEVIWNKVFSNEFVTRLGFPGVQHGLAPDLPSALAMARRLGFPVVAKPVRGGLGIGITANIQSEAELAEAFQKALDARQGRVLIERHIPGNDHRLVALNGRFAWCIRRTPAQVVGDGVHSVARLIAMENLQRSESKRSGTLILQLVIDAAALALLKKQGLTPESIPGAGRRVPLTTTANVASGGTIDDVSACVHPDNRDMVECIARALRMGTLGMDFITTDITRSWREGGCGVIEVNATPGLTSDGNAAQLLAAKIPEGTDGRIPTVVLLEAPDGMLEALEHALSARGMRTGRVDRTHCTLGDRERLVPHAPRAGLAARVQALLMDPACEALVVGMTVGELEAKGLPLDWCDRLVLWEGTVLSSALRALLDACSGEVLPLGGGASAAIPAILDGLLPRRLHPEARVSVC